MGRRGPKPKGEYQDKSATVSTRISAELRAKLHEAVQRSGLTISREVETRLRRSFGAEVEREVAFGSLRNYRLMQLVGIAMNLRAEPGKDWLKDPAQFLGVLRTIYHLLWAIRPPGTPNLPTAAGDWPTAIPAAEVAELLWSTVRSSDAAMPLDAGAQGHRLNVIKADLVDIVDRPRSRTNIPPPAAPAKAAKQKRRK